jgi:hypothetical protein
VHDRQPLGAKRGRSNPLKTHSEFRVGGDATLPHQSLLARIVQRAEHENKRHTESALERFGYACSSGEIKFNQGLAWAAPLLIPMLPGRDIVCESRVLLGARARAAIRYRPGFACVGYVVAGRWNDAENEAAFARTRIGHFRH